MHNLMSYLKLLLSKWPQKEALEFASTYIPKKYFTLTFKEADLTDHEPGNFIRQINSLVEDGYLRWDYVMDKTEEAGEKLYQIKDIALTVEGEKLLRTFSWLSTATPILIGVISGLLIAYIAVKI